LFRQIKSKNVCGRRKKLLLPERTDIYFWYDNLIEEHEKMGEAKRRRAANVPLAPLFEIADILFDVGNTPGVTAAFGTNLEAFITYITHRVCDAYSPNWQAEHKPFTCVYAVDTDGKTIEVVVQLDMPLRKMMICLHDELTAEIRDQVDGLRKSLH
jgi:hypothetical protein